MSVNDNSNNPGLSFTSGRNDPVWIKANPYSAWPRFKKLDRNLETHTVVVGAGISGISTAYELVKKGVNVVLIEAREVTSGESGRSSGELSDFLGMSQQDLIKLHGPENERLIYNSHRYAIGRVEEIAKNLNINCDYRRLDGQVFLGPEDHAPSEEIEAESSTKSGAERNANDLEQSPTKITDQAIFHPTKYMHGILRDLVQNNGDLFSCYTHSRMKAYTAIEDGVSVDIERSDYTIKAKNMVMAMNTPVRELRNPERRLKYFLATTIPTTDALSYIKFGDKEYHDLRVSTASYPDPSLQYLIVSGIRHKTGYIADEDYLSHFESLKKWTREHFPTAETKPEYLWSSQVVDSNDNLAYIGREKLGKNIFVITGDSASGLTYGIIGAKIISDQITGTENEWESIYDAARTPQSKLFDKDIGKVHLDELVNKSREERTYITDIEDLPRCQGTIMRRNNDVNGMPLAIWKDSEGKARTFTGLLHGSRFDAQTGKCVFGPANRDLTANDQAAKDAVALSVEL
ncbi:hypothetical protein ABW20_dc0100430 [Dactylellina cionopaga]|nr:hypothetical protein ABW20_dc0100430 [Dactylellina cionopaga]